MRSRTLIPWLAGLALLSVFALGIRPSLEMSGFLPDGLDPSTRIDPELRKAFRGSDRLLVVIEGAAPISPEQAAPIVARVAQVLGEIPEIAAVESRLSPELENYWRQAGQAGRWESCGLES